MSRPSKPKPAPAVATPETSDPAAAAPPQVTPEPTGAEAALAASVTAPVEPNPEADAQAPTADDEFVLRVIGPAKGRWRAGRKFGPEPVDIPANELTGAEIALLTGDPELTVLVGDETV